MDLHTNAVSNYTFPPPGGNTGSGYYKIVSMAKYLPDTQKSTAELLAQNSLHLKDNIVMRATGVATRHLAAPFQSDSDMLAMAAEACLRHADTSVNDLSRIFVNKLLGDRILPPTSALMQQKLNAKVAIQCMDIDGGSNGFLQALLMAGRNLDAGDTAVLIASGGVHQKLMDQMDSRTAYLFGDASTAVLLRASDQKHVLAQYEFSNYALGNLHHAVDFYHFIGEYLNGGKLALFEMKNLKESEPFFKQAAQHTMNTLLETAQCNAEDIDMFFVNQMTLPLWRSVVTHLNIPEEKLLSLLPSTGNTLSASLPLQLVEWHEQQIHLTGTLTGKTVMMISLGEGCLGGGCIYRF